MFDLEKSMADWRSQMLAAGIQSPVPLEELENHLREEIHRQVKLGLHESEAFYSAVQKIGPPESLKREFKNSIGFVEYIRRHKAVKLNFMLGLVWLVFYAASLLAMGARAFTEAHDLMALVSVLIFWSGMFGSVLLILDSKWGRSIIRTNALFFVVWCILLYVTRFGTFSSGFGAWSFITLCVVSIFILHWPRRTVTEVVK